MSGEASQMSSISGQTTGGSTTSAGRGYKGKKFNKNHQTNRPDHTNTIRDGDKKNSSFKGNSAEMCGHVFQVFSESRSEQQYNDTVEVLGQYISKNFWFASDMDVLVKELKVPVLKKPDAPKDKTNETDVKIWEAEIKQFAETEVTREFEGSPRHNLGAV